MKRKLIKALILTVIAISVFLVAMLLIMCFFVPGCCHDYLECDMNMHRIWVALQSYAEEHEGKLPVKLEELHPTYRDLTMICCPQSRKGKSPMETGYSYIKSSLKDDPKEPVLYCKRYHLNGHGQGLYCVEFNILTRTGTIVHVHNRELRKYDGAMRRYLYFRQFPYDGSVPTQKIVQSLKGEYPEEFSRTCWIDAD